MKLREALSDSADTPLYIETIPKRGYRFIAPVEAVGTGNGQVISEGAVSDATVIDTPVSNAPPHRKKRSVSILIACGMFLLLVGTG
jgi:DNA-binding winged helix-turn-helix (wHTH) protein